VNLILINRLEILVHSSIETKEDAEKIVANLKSLRPKIRHKELIFLVNIVLACIVGMIACLGILYIIHWWEHARRSNE
jgi:hypothetical protein